VNTKIRIHITIEQEGHEPQEFVQTVKGEMPTGGAVFASTVTGLEKVLSPIHAKYCPTPEEKART
jgi:hypothetical protein